MITIGIPVLNQFQSTEQTLYSLKAKQKYKENKYILFDNGSFEPLATKIKLDFGNDLVIRVPENIGLPKALNLILDNAKTDYVFFTHNDIEMFEQDWDEKILKAIHEAGNVGVAGFYGAMGIGTFDIYKTPYVMQQLVRTNPIAGTKCRQDPAIHGHSQFTQDWIKCGVLDGFSLIVKRDGVLRFEESFGPHHMYDNDICLQAYANHKQVICINMDIIHYGGRTDVNENWSKGFGKEKHEVHAEAHPPFYEKWRTGNNNGNVKLPFRV